MKLFLLVLIQLFLITLKVTETVDWSWWVIYTPIYVAILWVLIVLSNLFFFVSKITKQRRAFR